MNTKIAMRLVGLACGLMAAGPVWANPFASGNAETGRRIAAEHQCAGCHISRFGGDGSGIYTRKDRRVNSPDQLRAQISMCSTQLKSNLFPEEEEHLAAHLNALYYKFK